MSGNTPGDPRTLALPRAPRTPPHAEPGPPRPLPARRRGASRAPASPLTRKAHEWGAAPTHASRSPGLQPSRARDARVTPAQRGVSLPLRGQEPPPATRASRRPQKATRTPPDRVLACGRPRAGRRNEGADPAPRPDTGRALRGDARGAHTRTRGGGHSGGRPGADGGPRAGGPQPRQQHRRPAPTPSLPSSPFPNFPRARAAGHGRTRAGERRVR